MAENTKATVLAIVKQDDAGKLKAPTTGNQFIPLRSGFSVENSFEELTSDELLNDIGASKSYLGKESTSISHPIYLKHSGTHGSSPEYAPIFESLVGETINAPADTTVNTSTTGSATLASASGYEVGSAVLLTTAGGKIIRNIDAKTGNVIGYNFNSSVLVNGTGVKGSVMLRPKSSGHPLLSFWYYFGGGSAIQAVQDVRASEITIDLTAGQFATADISAVGTKSWLNPIEVTSANNKLDFNDGSNKSATIPVGFYTVPDLAREIEKQMKNISPLPFEVNFSNGKFTIKANANFSLLFSNANSIAQLIGFNAVDKSGAQSYISDNEITYLSGLTPAYDTAELISVKAAEFFIGEASDNFCRQASKVTISISGETTDVDSVCAPSGTVEKIPTSRTVTVTATMLLKKHEVALFDKFINNQEVKVMVNVGSKLGGDWVAGKCVNIYMPNASITQNAIDAGNEYLVVNFSAKGFLKGDKKDVYINFV